MSDTTAPSAAEPLFRDGNLPPLLVRASAGTGKTYRLTGRLLQILLQGAPPESILATTFTRKAAGEILERVLLSLAKAADPDHPEALAELRRQVALPRLTRHACRQLLQQLLANVHRLRVCTLDSLFSQLATSFAFELRLPPTWRLTDEIEEAWLSERAVDAVIAMLQPSELSTLLAMLSKGETRRSIARELLQVIGSVYRMSRQSDAEAWAALEAPTQPDEHALTSAAGALRSAQPPQKTVRQSLTKLADCVDARDFESLKDNRLLQNYAKAKRNGEPVKLGRSQLPDGLDDALGTVYAAVRSNALGLLRGQNEATGQVVTLFEEQAIQLKQSLRAFGFDDVAVRLANRFASLDPAVLSRRLDGAVDHVLLDEFQDTSPEQWQVLRPFARRAVARPDQVVDPEAPVPRSFFCVGDTKQAIYGWRGGVAEIFDAVDEELEAVRSIEQNTSFRSSPVIMEVVNQVFGNLNRHHLAQSADGHAPSHRESHQGRAIRAFSRAFPEHQAFRKGLPGYARLETAAKIEGAASDRSLACFELAADRIAELQRRAPERSIGVLTRTNKAVAQLIYLLEQRRVDVSQEGGNPLVDSAAVDLVLSALMMAEHPADGRWKFHVDHSPLGRVAHLSPRSVRQQVTEEGIARTVHRLGAYVKPVCDARDRLRLDQLTQLALAYEPNATPRLGDFVRLVREKRVERPQQAPVRVMTVHQSKGLEFDAVFLPELHGKLVGATPSCIVRTHSPSEPPLGLTRSLSSESWHFLDRPWQQSFGDSVAGQTTEALCLLYVAMTRPRQALYMIVPPGKPNDKKPAALVYAALPTEAELSDEQTLLYEHGDPQWFAAERPGHSQPDSDPDTAGASDTAGEIDTTGAAPDV